ncbi:MAG: hypothetical protein H0U46_09060 [Actinobacteria bacterium]|nr:hypothetical protein [Actinomycetota bacterium]
MKASIVILAACALLLAAWPAAAANPSLKGAVGPGETIKMTSKPKKAGTYKLIVQDRSSEHNFRLRGPGVNVATSVSWTGTKTFTVKLKAGKTYTFVCDPHADDMRGSFKVPA